MRRQRRWLLQLFIFYIFFTFEITFAEAKPHLFVDQPKGCSKDATRLSLCAISAGDQPYTFHATDSRWEIAKHTVIVGKTGNHWKVARGHFVIKSKAHNVIETPFGKLHIQNTDVFIELDEEKVHVSVLRGQPVTFHPRSEEDPLRLTQGFQNWYGGLSPQGQTFGVPQVMNIKDYAKKRAYFFIDHKLGFVNELKTVAGSVQIATNLSAQIHADLIRGKRGLLEDQYQEGVHRKELQIQYSKDLRRLFRKKVRYDD